MFLSAKKSFNFILTYLDSLLSNQKMIMDKLDSLTERLESKEIVNK